MNVNKRRLLNFKLSVFIFLVCKNSFVSSLCVNGKKEASFLKSHICSHALPMQNSDTFSVKFSVYKNFTSATVFNIKTTNFRPLLTFTYSFHFGRLQSANVRFLIASRTVERVPIHSYSVRDSIQTNLPP